MRRLRGTAWIRVLAPIAVCLLLLAAACGGDDDDDGNGATTAPAGTEAQELAPQPPSPQEVEEEVTEASGSVIETMMGDNFFTRNNLKAPLNETTTIELTNDGAAIHNMRIAGPDGEWNTDDDIVSDPENVLGGQTATVEFTPTVAGTYTFRCDIHPTEQGGVIVVE